MLVFVTPRSPGPALVCADADAVTNVGRGVTHSGVQNLPGSTVNGAVYVSPNVRLVISTPVAAARSPICTITLARPSPVVVTSTMSVK